MFFVIIPIPQVYTTFAIFDWPRANSKRPSYFDNIMNRNLGFIFFTYSSRINELNHIFNVKITELEL